MNSAIASFALITFLPLGDSLLKNGDFEAKAAKDGAIVGWKVDVGAMNGDDSPRSTVSLDPKNKAGGKQSLHFSGNSKTRAWLGAEQEIPARPGGKYTLRGKAKVEKVRQEQVEDTDITQFANGYATVWILDGNGEIVAKQYTHFSGSSNWKDFSVKVEAPENARKAKIYLFLSMSGDLWFDDLDLAIEGGKERPAPMLLFREGFESASKLPPEWYEEVGATNGTGSNRLKVEIDPKVGVEGSPRSLHLAGGENTIKWYAVRRKLPAAPGDSFQFRCQVQAKEIRREAIQFTNFHQHVFFLDKDGKEVGSAKFGNPGTGSYEWKESAVEAVAPEGAATVVVGFFLSMSGDAWIDRIELSKDSGGTPAYAGWLTKETAHLTLRYPKDFPRAKEMDAYAKKLEETFQSICKQLDVRYDEKVTMFLYRDKEQGRNLTGRDLAFAEPDMKQVHQGPTNTLGHELTHCIALKIGYSGTGLLGEGIGVWLDGALPASHHDRAAALLREGKLPSIQDLMERFREQENGYPAAGSFTGFLIERKGLGIFKQVYTLENAEAMEGPLGKRLEDFAGEWLEFLRTRSG